MIEKFLEKLKVEYSNILANNLVGIYLHGSIVFNCFNPEKSDIDFIVVVNNNLDYETKKELIEVLMKLESLAPKKGFEMSIVLKEHSINFKYPTPYELHFSNSWIDKYLENHNSLCNDDFKTDPDLAAHFTVIKNCGQVICGDSINEVFGRVKKEYYIDSIYNDIVSAKEDIIKDFTYMTLNLCRVLAYLKDDKVLSKEQGGLWGLENLKEEYRPIIQNALDNYKNNIDINIDNANKINFADYMLNIIKSYFEPNNERAITKKIVAIGGGENGRLNRANNTYYPYETGVIDLEIIRLTGKEKPNFLFLGHASGQFQEGYFDVMVKIYNKMYGCECKMLHSDNLNDKEKVQSLIEWADIIYEGGGNTKAMMQLWKESDFDKILIQAYNNGKVMCGISAGANCWFKACSSDSLQIELNNPNAPLIKVECLGLIDGLFTPHCDEKNRLTHMKDLLQSEDMVGIAMSNCAAIEIIDDEYRLITSDASFHGISAYGVKAYWENGEYIEQKLKETTYYNSLEDLLSKASKTTALKK